MRGTRSRRMVGFVALAIQVLTVGCDPGMTIRQVGVPGRSASTASTSESQVEVSVGTTHPIIGNTSYFAEADVTNASASLISVTNIELFARNKTYANEFPEEYPAKIPPGKTSALRVMFRLNADLWQTFFREPAELLVHYESGSQPKVARVTIIGAHLDGSR
jgi:hypothetical protein